MRCVISQRMLTRGPKSGWGSEELDLATLLSSVATHKEAASDDSLLYQPEGEFVTLTQFENASRRYPAKKARGADGWGTTEFASLPSFIVLHLLALLRRCHHSLRWPEGMRVLYESAAPNLR